MSKLLDDLFGSKYLKAEDLPEEGQVVTIKEISTEKIGPKQEQRMILNFRNGVKPMVLNKTNGKMMIKLYGDDEDEWEGKQIIVYPTMVQFAGDEVLGIRIKDRIPKPAAEGKAAPKRTPAEIIEEMGYPPEPEMEADY